MFIYIYIYVCVCGGGACMCDTRNYVFILVQDYNSKNKNVIDICRYYSIYIQIIISVNEYLNMCG